MNPSDNRSQEIRFHYVKSNAFRVVHADGAWGGVAPRGGAINLAFWSERNPIPREIVHQLDAEGKLGEELVEKRVVRTGFIREVDFEVVLSLANARELRRWLDKVLAEADPTERE